MLGTAKKKKKKKKKKNAGRGGLFVRVEWRGAILAGAIKPDCQTVRGCSFPLPSTLGPSDNQAREITEAEKKVEIAGIQ